MAKRRRLWWILLGVAAAIGGAYWWEFLQVPPPGGTWSLDLPEVRRMAQSMAGDKPREIRVERVVDFGFPGAIVRAGGGWGFLPMAVYSYQLVFPSHTAIIDTAMKEPIPGGKIDKASFERVGRGLGASDLIVVTHEHVDHLGGLLAQPEAAKLLKVARLTREQVSHPEAFAPYQFPAGALDTYQPLAYERYLAVAPGVVLIRAPGHTPGSQMVYVQRADGTEYLFLGDVAWRATNVASTRERPRAITSIIGEDRPQVMKQLQELHRISESEPNVHQVPGHDPTVVDSLLEQHLLGEHFQL